MAVLDTNHKRKSAAITAVILLLLLFAVFNYGMKYLDPPIEYGIAVNFGNADVGSGEPVEETKQAETSEEQEVEEEQTEEVVEEEVTEEAVQEELLTDDEATDAPTIEKPKENTETAEESVEKKEAEKPKPKPSKAATDALNSLLNGASKSGANQGEGDDDKLGTKGKKNGDPNASNYYGNSSGGSGGNYNLAGRKALSKPIRKPDCQEEGRVVVSIEVNQNGKVIKAIPGVKGSTNTAACLLKAAKEAAMQTKWNADGKAPSKQRGTIVYNFSLSQ